MILTDEQLIQFLYNFVHALTRSPPYFLAFSTGEYSNTDFDMPHKMYKLYKLEKYLFLSLENRRPMFLSPLVS